MKIGFIGLGQMGSAMATNLLKAGHDVAVFNRSRGKLRPLIELGAHAAASTADACRGELVVTMLADDRRLTCDETQAATGNLIARPRRNSSRCRLALHHHFFRHR